MKSVNLYFSISIAILLVCGSSIGPHFGTNQAYALEGSPTDFKISQIFEFETKLYKVVDKEIQIDVPYRQSAIYEMWMTQKPLTNSGK